MRIPVFTHSIFVINYVTANIQFKTYGKVLGANVGQPKHSRFTTTLLKYCTNQ